MKDYGVILTPVNQGRNPAIVAQAIQKELQRKKLKYVKEVIATSEEIFIATDKSKKAVKEITSLAIPSATKQKWNLPILFHENEDWNQVSIKTGISKEDYIRDILQLKITVQMFGFLPGFVYAKGLAKKLQVARKESPVFNRTPNVLATGGPYLGIYSLPSPSGWYILGKIPLDVLDRDKDVPMPFKIDDQLIIESISEKEFQRIKNQNLNLISYNA